MKTSIVRTLPLIAAVVLASCGEDTAGPKPPSAKSTVIEVVTTLSKTAIGVGDTLTFTYTVKNLTNAPLTLNTAGGCAIWPQLDQVEGPRMQDLFQSSCEGSSTPTVTTFAAGEIKTYAKLLRGYDASKPTAQQTPGYLLTKGTFDASMLVSATELAAPVRSDWVRFKVNVP